MSVDIRAHHTTTVPGGFSDGDLFINVHPEGNACVINAKGELDLATHNQLFTASTAGNHPAMVIDLTGVTFMDCSGYGCLVACRLVIEQCGRSLAIRGQTAQPARLLDMIAALEAVEKLGAGNAGSGSTRS